VYKFQVGDLYRFLPRRSQRLTFRHWINITL